MKTAQAAEIAELIPDGAVLMIGGFMGEDTSPRLMDALVRRCRHNLIVIANGTARPGVDFGKFIDAKLVGRVITKQNSVGATFRRPLAGR